MTAEREPRVTDATGRTTPEERRAQVRAGRGFYMTRPASRKAVLAYMRLYLAQRTEWDEPPELGVLRSEYDQHVTGYAFPYPEGIWDAWDHPGKLIRKLADLTWHQGRTDHALLRPIDRSLLGDMTGVYLRTEGWAPPKGTERTALGLHAHGHHYRFSDVEGRREVRTVEYAQGDGTMFRVCHYRDDPDTFSSQAWHPDDPGHGTYMGGSLRGELLKMTFGFINHLRPAYVNDPDRCEPITEEETNP